MYLWHMWFSMYDGGKYVQAYPNYPWRVPPFILHDLWWKISVSFRNIRYNLESLKNLIGRGRSGRISTLQLYVAPCLLSRKELLKRLSTGYTPVGCSNYLLIHSIIINLWNGRKRFLKICFLDFSFIFLNFIVLDTFVL